jgi:hypothetical protein
LEKRSRGALYWSPRIIAILLIILMALMSLDVFESGGSAWDIAAGLFMHNIPVFIMIIILVVAWKYEIVGGIAFILAGAAYILFAATSGQPWYRVISWSLTIAGPAFIVGALFLVNWFRKKKNINL